MFSNKENIQKIILENNINTNLKTRLCMQNTNGLWFDEREIPVILSESWEHVPKNIVKGKYYDVVLNAIRQINPNYTEEELIGECEDGDGYIRFNTNVVDNINEEHDKLNRVYGEPKYSLCINVAFVSIENNTDKILEIVNSYNKICN